MKKIIILILLLPFPAFAHTGHDHADGLHQTIAVITILSSIIIIFIAAKYLKSKKKNINK